VTINSLVNELEDARQLAVERGQASAAVAASMGKAKVTGQVIDKTEVGRPGEFDGMTDEDLQTRIVEALSKDIETYEQLLQLARCKRAASMHGATGNGSSRH
jgi:hypothetical protein